MFIDGRSLSAGEALEADLAIVGAGAAGITLARALKDIGAANWAWAIAWALVASN